MPELSVKTWSLAATFVGLATLVAAQTPPGGSAAGPSSATTQTALKLAGLVTFVANSCPTLKPNYARFEAALGALGVSTSDLEKADMKAGYLAQAARYNEDSKASCLRADSQFGPHGTTIADIFEPR